MKKWIVFFSVILFIAVICHISMWVYIKPVINDKITMEESQQIAESLDIILDEKVYVTKTYIGDDDHRVLITGFDNPLDFVINNLKMDDISPEEKKALSMGIDSVEQKNPLYEIDGCDWFRLKTDKLEVRLYNIDGRYYAEIPVGYWNRTVGEIAGKGRIYLSWKYY